MKSLVTALLLAVPGLCTATSFNGCASWPTNMATGHLKDAGITDPGLLDHSKTKAVPLAVEKIGKDLWRQVYEITFHEASGRVITVITENESSSTECSISGVAVWVVSKKLGWLELPENTR